MFYAINGSASTPETAESETVYKLIVTTEPLVASFSFPAFKRDRRMTKTKKKSQKKRKADFSLLLKNEHVEEEFYGDVVRLMNENVDSDMTIEKLDEVLNEASIKIPKKPLRNPTNTWDTDIELQNLLKKRDLISRSEN